MRFIHVLLGILATAIWGANFVFIKEGLQAVPPLFFCFLRFFLASFPILFFVKPPKTPFFMIFLYGVTMFVLQFGLLFIGIHLGAPVGLSSLVLQAQVFFTPLLAVLFCKEKLTLWQVVGAFISFSGIGLVAIHAGETFTIAGFVFLLGAALAWSLGNVISKKIGKVNIVALVVWGSLVAWPLLLGASFAIEGQERIFMAVKELTLKGCIAVLYVTYLGTLIGFGIWSFLLSRYPLIKISPFSLLTPLFALASSFIVFRKPFSLWEGVVAVLIVGGLLVNLLGAWISHKLHEKKGK